jgi:hypothetical protein
MNWFEFFETTELDQEQISATDKLENLIREYKRKHKRLPTKLYISENEELSSYLMWAGMAYSLKSEITRKVKTYVE